MAIDQAKRDAIITAHGRWNPYGLPADSPQYGGGIALYTRLSLAGLERLVAEGYADLDDAQNDSPTLGEFLEFMRRWPVFFAEGYVVAAERDDCRVTVTGLCGPGDCQDAKDAFMDLAADADDVKFSPPYDEFWCWWD